MAEQLPCDPLLLSGDLESQHCGPKDTSERHTEGAEQANPAYRREARLRLICDVGQNNMNLFESPSREYLDALSEEQLTCTELLRKDFGNQCLRRMYCRSTAAQIEGSVAYFKAFAYRFNEGCLRPFAATLDAFGVVARPRLLGDIVPTTEAELLLEQTFEVSNDGQIVRRPRFLDFKANFRFTFSMVDRIFKIAMSPDLKTIHGVVPPS